jgi:signal transduction histidine kinase
LVETEGVRRDRSLVADGSGRIWLSLNHSLAVADGNAARAYRQSVRVRIDSISLEDEKVRPTQGMRLSPGIRSITFRYSGTSLALNQRVLLRYSLTGLDQTWSTDASSRQVVYTHLTPGSYTFRAIASNALGIWNGPETDIKFVVRPAYWQTWYFRTLCALAAAFLVVVLYRFRLMQVTTQLDRRFQDRLVERTRIAQDLHDTLLQGLISASMQLDVAQERVSADSPAKPSLQHVLQLMQQVMEEGRRALRALRTNDDSADLETRFLALGSMQTNGSGVHYEVRVEGQARPLQSALLDEVYRIGKEAWSNAMAHAQASQIVVILQFGRRAFRMHVRDDGRGIPPAILSNMRESHRGISGMKQGARAIGSVLKIRSRVLGGTDVELVVPSAIAYTRVNPHRFPWSWKFRREDPDAREEE